MRRRLLSLVVVSLVASIPAAAEAPAIEHQPLACAVAGRFPQLTASFSPADAVARARVQFQSEGGRHWYGVAMKPAGTAFSAVLPKPKKSLKSYRYYIEVTDTALGTGRTAEYTTTVGSNRAACSDVKAAEGLASAAVKLEVPAGAPAAPGGFSTSGVIAASAAGAAVVAGATATATAAAGGGISAAVLVVGGVAVLAGAGAAVVAAGRSGNDGDGGDQGGGGQTVYSGPYNGQFVLFMHFVGARGPTTCSATHVLSGTATIRLDQTTGAVTGNFSVNGTGAKTADTCPGGNIGLLVSDSWGAPLTGTAGALEARLQQEPMTSTNVYAFTGALSGGVITGMITITHSGGGTPQSGQGSPFTTDGSATIPVTLR